MRGLAVVIAAGCGIAPPARPLGNVARSPAIGSPAASVAPPRRDPIALGDAARGCALMVPEGCARCHHHGADPGVYAHHLKVGLDGMRRTLAAHPVVSPLAAGDAEDLVTCMYERWH